MRSRTWLVAGIVVTVAASGLITLVALRGPSARQNPGVAAHGQPIVDVRTVLVTDAGPVGVSRPGSALRTSLQRGAMPAERMMATVLTDENCAPDAQGVSHCTNRIRLDGGAELTVTHPHRMAEVACLSPGERVAIQRA